MLLFISKNGWPDFLVDDNHGGLVPDGHVAFEDWDSVNAWKGANEHLRPESNLPPAPLPVPSEVPAWAFRSALSLARIRQAAEAEINALPEPYRTITNDQFWGNFIERHHPLIDQLAGRIGLTPAQVDDLFRVAGGLAVQFRRPAPIS